MDFRPNGIIMTIGMAKIPPANNTVRGRYPDRSWLTSSLAIPTRVPVAGHLYGATIMLKCTMPVSSKTCRGPCGKTKLTSDFYKVKNNKDGLQGICKRCHIDNGKAYRAKHRDKLNTYFRQYHAEHKAEGNASSRQRYAEHRLAYAIRKKEYRNENHQRVLDCEAKLREANQHKIAAHSAVREAIRRGELVKGICELCEAVEVDAHHFNYEKPLEVNFLCRKHHSLVHRWLRAIARALEEENDRELFFNKSSPAP